MFAVIAGAVGYLFTLVVAVSILRLIDVTFHSLHTGTFVAIMSGQLLYGTSTWFLIGIIDDYFKAPIKSVEAKPNSATG